MKKILLVSAFALIGTFAMANETKSSGFEIKMTTVEVNGVACCTATVTYNDEVVKTFTECNAGSTASNCGLVKMFAENYVREQGGTV
ncbi:MULTISPECIES: hypothetical protein [unclassified Empedobacter]|uniref:hypothetical protein n=1 Tax=unclassified Empedobacter TaxID=2643773 RepID=UPI0025BC8D7F|nr:MULTISPECIES: hypothetical protein [unclassified Empedobacter]